MRILQVNKFNYAKGGADKYFLDLTHALEAAGHQTAVFAMKHPKNEESPWEKYFVSQVNFDDGGKNKLRIPGRMIYSLEAKTKFRRLLDDFKPDVIHCHNIYHQISPSILDAAKAKRIPVVMHLHDYKLICPNYRLFVKNNICYRCLDKKNFRPCVKNNCYGSPAKSFLAYLEMTIHHKLLKIYENNLDCLIAPSQFIKELVVRSGWPEQKIITLYNPAPTVVDGVSKTESEANRKNNRRSDDYFLYFGRLAPEKGIKDLMNAVKNNNWKLKIAGDGPEEKNLRQLFAPEIESGQITFLGYLSGQPLAKQIEGAQAIIIPSRWPENMPLNLLESLARGKIIIASRVGGLPEIIKDGENGFLFTPGNIKELEAKIKQLLKLKPEEIKKIKFRAMTLARRLNPDDHLLAIIKIYQRLAKKSD